MTAVHMIPRLQKQRRSATFFSILSTSYLESPLSPLPKNNYCATGSVMASSPSMTTWAFLLATLCLTLCRGSSAAAVCYAGDKQALLQFHSELIDTGKYLAPWKATTNCCTWPVSNVHHKISFS